MKDPTRTLVAVAGSMGVAGAASGMIPFTMLPKALAIGALAAVTFVLLLALLRRASEASLP